MPGRRLERLLEVHPTGHHCARAAPRHQAKPPAVIRLSAPQAPSETTRVPCSRLRSPPSAYPSLHWRALRPSSKKYCRERTCCLSPRQSAAVGTDGRTRLSSLIEGTGVASSLSRGALRPRSKLLQILPPSYLDMDFSRARPSSIKITDLLLLFGSSMRPRSCSRFAASQSIPLQTRVRPRSSHAVR